MCVCGWRSPGIYVPWLLAQLFTPPTWAWPGKKPASGGSHQAWAVPWNPWASVWGRGPSTPTSRPSECWSRLVSPRTSYGWCTRATRERRSVTIDHRASVDTSAPGSHKSRIWKTNNIQDPVAINIAARTLFSNGPGCPQGGGLQSSAPPAWFLLRGSGGRGNTVKLFDGRAVWLFGSTETKKIK